MSQATQRSTGEPGGVGARIRATAERLVFASAAYRLLLIGGVPTGLTQSPPACAGDAARGAAILRGEFALAGERVTLPDPWAADLVTAAGHEAWRMALHGFAWLADLRAEGSAAARERARALIASWIERFGEWSPLAWRGDVLGRRVIAWLADSAFFLADADEAFRDMFFRALARQLRHLDNLARLGGGALGPAGHPRLVACVALAHAAACLAGGRDRLARALALLQQEAGQQVLPDGGHVQRSPALQLAALRDLVGVRGVLLAGHHAVPDGLQRAIDRMAPMLRFYRHGDGRLALFNGAREGDAAAIDGVLALADAAGKPPASAPHTGFQRLAAGGTLVIVDTGAPPPPGLDGDAHAGTLSFEMSAGPERLIVNCGARPNVGGEWLAAQRASAAHSTLVLANANSSDVLAGGQLGRRPRQVLCRREEAEGAVLVDTSHDGYATPFGVVHRRRLYLSAAGDDLRGEDRLTRIRAGERLPFALRFHLHPEVQASLMHDGAAALLRLPSGAGLRFDAAGGRIAVEESIYLGGETPRRSEQIVLTSTLAGEEAVVKWSIKRVGGEP